MTLPEQYIDACNRYGGAPSELRVPYAMYMRLDDQHLVMAVKQRIGFGNQASALFMGGRLGISDRISKDATMEQCVIRSLWREDKL